MKVSRRRLLLILAAVVLLVVAARLAFVHLAARRVERHWGSVQVGMSKAEVRALLGKPATVYTTGTVQSDSLGGAIVGTMLANMLLDTALEKWAYGRRRTLCLDSRFPYVDLALDGCLVPEDEDYVVYFSAGGKVVKKVHPYRPASDGPGG